MPVFRDVTLNSKSLDQAFCLIDNNCGMRWQTAIPTMKVIPDKNFNITFSHEFNQQQDIVKLFKLFATFHVKREVVSTNSIPIRQIRFVATPQSLELIFLPNSLPCLKFFKGFRHQRILRHLSSKGFTPFHLNLGKDFADFSIVSDVLTSESSEL